MLLPLLLALVSLAAADNAQLSKDFYEERTVLGLPWNKQPGVPVPTDPFSSTAEDMLSKVGGGVSIGYKNCTDQPVGQFDIIGINTCRDKNYTHGCVSTYLPPFYDCTCVTGMTCTFCNISTTPCATADMDDFCASENTKSCTPTENDCQPPNCVCKPGWTTDPEAVLKGTGRQCGEDINECVGNPNPCKNGAACENTPGSYKCLCAKGFGGPNCAYDAGCNDSSMSVPCAAAATCHIESFDGKPYGQCKCKPGTTGDPWVSCGHTDNAYTIVSGDPHFKTFDSTAYRDYMGTCPVTYVRPCEHLPHIPNFKVVLTASTDCNPTGYVSCVKFTYLDVYGHRIQFVSRAITQTYIIVDGTLRYLPYNEIPGIHISAGNPGRGVIYSVKTNFTMSMTVQAFDTSATIIVHLPRSESLRGKLCGLGGNMDGNAATDTKKPDGTMAKDLNDWGDSWAAENIGSYDSLGCVFGKAISQDTAKQRADEIWAGTNTPCRYFTDNTGPFKDCFDPVVLNPAVIAAAYQNCICDMGAFRGKPANFIQDTACEEHLKPFAEKCRNALAEKKDVKKWEWRAGICPAPNCPDHAHFNEYAPTCISSCEYPDAGRQCPTSQTQEACVCDISDTEWYVFTNGKCVPYPQGCPGHENGVTVLSQQQMVDLLCSKNCLYLGDSNDAESDGLFCKPLKCADHASCAVTPDRKRDCVCDTGYFGDGRHLCRVPQRNCADLQHYHGVKSSGVSKLGIWSYLDVTRKAHCDMETEGGGWTVIQRRVDTTNFNRTWKEYAMGFGELKHGSFWYGLEMLHVLTMYNTTSTTLRIDFEDCDGKKTYQKYEDFKVEDASQLYRLTYSKTSGTAGDAFASTEAAYVSPNGMAFSTYDNDHDSFQGTNCPLLYGSGWWHRECTAANVNGRYYPKCGGAGKIDAATWYSGASKKLPHCMKKMEMKLRPAVYPPTD